MPEFTIYLPETLVPLLNRKAKEKNESPESCLAAIVAVSLEDESKADPARERLEDILEERMKGPFVPVPDDLVERVMAKAMARIQQRQTHV
ncbi:MAG TPA: hypothetical protein PLB55_08690 [Prosthecobacter sp.]|nr:hypothetical protein [Prosthecobacter sp.]